MMGRAGQKVQSNDQGVSRLLLLAAIGGPMVFADIAIRYGHRVVQNWTRVLPGVEKRLEQIHEKPMDSDQADPEVEKLLCVRRHGPRICIR